VTGIHGLVGGGRHPRPSEAGTAPQQTPGVTESLAWRAEWGWITGSARAQDFVDIAHCADSGRTVVLVGHVYRLRGDAPEGVSAHAVLRELGPEVRPSQLDLEGAFLCAVVDERTRTVDLWGDHLGSLPLYYGAGGTAGFSSSLHRAVALTGDSGALCDQGIASFLAMGFLAGGRTFDSGIRRLRPAEHLRLGERGVEAARRWWQPPVEVAPRNLKRDEAAEQLEAILLRSHRGALLDAPARPLLALTGGLDSRVVGACLRHGIGRDFEAFTWSAGRESTESDGTLADQLSGLWGVPHRCLRYTPSNLAANTQEWAHSHGIETANAGQWAAGLGFLADCGYGGGTVFTGDQVLGHRPQPRSGQQVLSRVFGAGYPELDPVFSRFLTDDAVHSVAEAMAALTAPYVDLVGRLHPLDLSLLLDLEFGVHGWILGAGNYREPAMPVRRPLMSRDAIAAVSSWPHHLRCDKVVLKATLARIDGQTHNLPLSRRADTFDWGTLLATEGPLRDELLSLANRASFLTRGPVDQMVSVQDAVPAPSSRLDSWRGLAVQMRRAVSDQPLIGPLVRLADGLRADIRSRNSHLSPTQAVIRLAGIGAMSATVRTPEPVGSTGVRTGPSEI